MAEQQTWQWPSRMALLADHSENNPYFTCKRCLDVFLAGLLLILLLPLLVLIAVLIKLDSPGPVIFTQERVGAKRQWLGRQAIWIIRNFTMYKFRSMVQNADTSVHEAYIRDFVEGRAQASPENGGPTILV
jgi:lipopolysaccharide/colanic/teichoic acid biosynthesis glycosyltransferase